MSNKNNTLDNLLKLVKAMPEERLNSVVNELYEKFASELNQEDNTVYSLNEHEVAFCRKCGASHIVKNGKDRRGHTRYLCRKCGATFSELTGTAVAGSHKDATTWKKYISLLLDGYSIARSAKECSISPTTAFVWRHKILSALTKKSFSPCFRGVIEMDEMYVRLSYKGNHKHSKGFTMPRPAFKRGSDNRIPGNNAKASILCLVERDKGFYGTIPCRGTINLPLLQQIFEEKVSDESIVLTDGLRAYNQYFRTTNVEHIVLPSNEGRPSVCGPYHINNVNALQRRFRRFLADYNGVSTKHLNNYLALFLWMENNRYYDREKLMVEELECNGSYTPFSKISNLPPVPELPPAA